MNIQLCLYLLPWWCTNPSSVFILVFASIFGVFLNRIALTCNNHRMIMGLDFFIAVISELNFSYLR